VNRISSACGFLGRLPIICSIEPPGFWRHDAEEPGTLVVKHRSTGLYLAADGEWTIDRPTAHRFTDHDHALRLVERHACEVGAFELLSERET
jgi:hypothetical protein